MQSNSVANHWVLVLLFILSLATFSTSILSLTLAKPLDSVLNLLDEVEKGILELISKVKVILIDVLKVVTGLCIGLGAILWLMGFRYEGKRLLILGLASVFIIGILSI
mgnify:CR=1 FL=1